jgi:hypothetical protein
MFPGPGLLHLDLPLAAGHEPHAEPQETHERDALRRPPRVTGSIHQRPEPVEGLPGLLERGPDFGIRELPADVLALDGASRDEELVRPGREPELDCQEVGPLTVLRSRLFEAAAQEVLK